MFYISLEKFVAAGNGPHDQPAQEIALASLGCTLPPAEIYERVTLPIAPEGR